MEKTLHAEFKSKNFADDFHLVANISRKIKSTAGDNSELFERVEQSRDSIDIVVYETGTKKKVAACYATLSQVISDEDVDLIGQVFDSRLTAAIYYAALRLSDQQRRQGTYGKASVSVLSIDKIEVQKKYREKGIGRNIIDFLNNVIHPDFVCVLIPSTYCEKVGYKIPVVMKTDILVTKRFWDSLHLHDCGEVLVMDNREVSKIYLMTEDNVNTHLYARNPKVHR